MNAYSDILEKVRQDPSLLSPDELETWAKQVANSEHSFPHYLENQTKESIHSEIDHVLSNYQCGIFSDKLQGYRYVEHICDLVRGKYIRWIRNSNTPSLTNGGILVDVKFLDNGVHILTRTAQNRFIQYKFDDCLTFQKLSAEEWLLLCAMTYTV